MPGLLLGDALLALLAVVPPNDHPATRPAPSPAHEQAVRRFRREAQWVREQQGDALTRSREPFEQFLASAARKLGPEPPAAPSPVPARAWRRSGRRRTFTAPRPSNSPPATPPGSPTWRTSG